MVAPVAMMGSGKQVSRFGTPSIFRLYLSSVHMHDMKCLNLDSYSILRLSQRAAVWLEQLQPAKMPMLNSLK